MHPSPIAAVMVHVADLKAGLAWYAAAFPTARLQRDEAHNFEYLDFEGVRIEVVQADKKVSSGPSGTVVYWRVVNFAAELERLQKLGATLYRGPMKIENDEMMCQVQDPWGNCLGLRGK